MSVLTNISLSGLSIDSNDFLYCGEVDVTGSLTMEPGSTLNLQPNSVSDSALSTNVALKNAIQTFTNNNTFTNLLTMNAGFNSLGQGTIRRATANVHLRMIDTTFNSFGDLYTRNQILFLRQNLPSSLIRFQLYNASNVISDVFTIGTDQALFNISVPITQNGTMPASNDASNKTPTTQWVQDAILLNNSSLLSSNNIWSGTNNYSVSFPTCSVTIPASNDSTTKLSTTQWVQSAITANNSSLLSSTNVWTGSNTFSRTAGNMNLRLLDSTNNTTFTGAVGNNQINLIMSNNDSKIYLNTFTPAGVQTNTLLVNSTTTSLNTTNPLVQTATMPAVSDNSTYTPTTAWVQSVLTFNIGALLNANNSWGGTNTFSQQVNANGGIVLTRPSAANAIQIIDATSLNSNTLSVNGVAARYIQNGLSSVHNFFVRDASNVQFTSASISKSLVNFNSDTITWTGTNPPVTDNTQKLVTTSFLTSKINNFLTLNNTWTGTNQFNNQVTIERSGIDIPLVIGSSSTVNYKGNQFISNSAGSYNPIVSANEYVIFAYNNSAIDLSTLTLTSHSSTGSGIKISNNLTKVFGANEFEKEIKTSTTDPPGSQCLGQIITIQRFVFPNLNWNAAWTGTAPNVNLYSYTFDNSTADKRYGTYMVQFQLVYTNTTAQKDFIANINEVSAATELSPFMTVCGNTNVQNYGGTFYYSIFVTMTIQIYGTKTLYFNCKLGSTGGTGSFTDDSYVRFIRIA